MKNPKKLARLLKVLSVETRVRIVQLLKSQALCVNALAKRLKVTQGAVSQHLRFMRNAGLVIDEKHGYFVHYHLNEDTLAAWREDINKLLGSSREARSNKKGELECAAAKKRRKAARSRKS